MNFLPGSVNDVICFALCSQGKGIYKINGTGKVGEWARAQKKEPPP